MSNYRALPVSDSSGKYASNSNNQIAIHDPFDGNSKDANKLAIENSSSKYAIESSTTGNSNEITKFQIHDSVHGEYPGPNKKYALEQLSVEGEKRITKKVIVRDPDTERVNDKASDTKKVDEEQTMEIWRSISNHGSAGDEMLEDGIRVSDRELVPKDTVYETNYDGNSDTGKKTVATEASFDAEIASKRHMRGDIQRSGRGGRDFRTCLFHTAWILALLLVLAIGAFVYFFIQFQNSQAELQRLGSAVTQCDVVTDNCAPLRAANDHLLEVNNQLNGTVIGLQNDNQNLLDEVGRLHNQLDQLLANIEGLDGNVSGLLDNLEEYRELNDQLSASIDELEQQNQLLNNSNVWYADLNAQLNESIAELESHVEDLAEQNQIYAGLNDDLNATAERLSGEVDRLEEQVDVLGQENENLAISVNNLSDEVDQLRDLNDVLRNTTDDLELQVDRLTNEINRLEDLNNDLENIASFLNETANDFDETYEAITSFLSEQITAYRSVALEILQNTYTQRIANWDCAYRDMFRLEEFVNDDRLSIGPGAYAEVMEYVEERVLSDLCLSTRDYETYLENRWVQQGVQPPVSATTNELITSVQLYTMAAMNYYFPDSDDVGLTQADWAEAEYTCDNLPADKRFSM